MDKDSHRDLPHHNSTCCVLSLHPTHLTDSYARTHTHTHIYGYCTASQKVALPYTYPPTHPPTRAHTHTYTIHYALRTRLSTAYKLQVLPYLRYFTYLGSP